MLKNPFRRASPPSTQTGEPAQDVVPTGELLHLPVEKIRPSQQNPRILFDPEPLKALKDSIEEHGVLVPLTVFKLPGQDGYGIVDGERRHRCCVDLGKEGHPITLPANVVAPPDQTASLIYMFNIHQFRQQWELMPTAMALKTLTEALKTDDTKELTQITGLSERQVERCKTVLAFPERFTKLSLEADPKTRIPSNFWVELDPVLDLTEELLPDLIHDRGRDGITESLVDKYRNKRIKSVIHFRRILEAHDAQRNDTPLLFRGHRGQNPIRGLVPRHDDLGHGGGLTS